MSGIIRKAKSKEDPYARISKTLLEDSNMSWKAKGLLCYLLSKPDNWTIRVNDLVKHATEGRDAVYSILKELIRLGYVVRTQPKEEKTMKFAQYEYIVHEEPITVDNPPKDDEPIDDGEDEPLTEKPYTDSPYTENPDINNNDVSKNECISCADARTQIKELDLYLKNKLPKSVSEVLPRTWSRDNSSVIKCLLKKVSAEEIKSCIDWGFKDEFWKLRIDKFSVVAKVMVKYREFKETSKPERKNMPKLKCMND